MALLSVLALSVALSPLCDDTCWLSRDGVCDETETYVVGIDRDVGCERGSDCEDCNRGSSPALPSPAPVPDGRTIRSWFYDDVAASPRASPSPSPDPEELLSQSEDGGGLLRGEEYSLLWRAYYRQAAFGFVSSVMSSVASLLRRFESEY